MAIKLSDITHAFYVPGKPGTIDAVHPVTGRGVWGGQTLEEIQAEYPGAVKESFDVILAAEEDHFRKAPVEVDAARWDYALGVLPPLHWKRTGDAETFKISEMTSGTITAIYCRIGDRYFELSDSVSLTHEQIVEKVRPLL